MDIQTTARSNGSGIVDRVDIVANGTTIRIADAPGEAVQITVTDAQGGRVVDVTIRRGQVGPEGGD